MARNDQVIRQWHILRRLEGSAALTLQELVAGLPDELPRHFRTLRRDLAPSRWCSARRIAGGIVRVRVLTSTT